MPPSFTLVSHREVVHPTGRWVPMGSPSAQAVERASSCSWRWDTTLPPASCPDNPLQEPTLSLPARDPGRLTSQFRCLCSLCLKIRRVNTPKNTNQRLSGAFKSPSLATVLIMCGFANINLDKWHHCLYLQLTQTSTHSRLYSPLQYKNV